MTIVIDKCNDGFYGTIRDNHGIGFYLPKEVVTRRNLINKKPTFAVEKNPGFFSKVGSDGRVYISIEIADKLKLENNDLVLVKGDIDNISKMKYCLVKLRRRLNSCEYRITFYPEFKGKLVLLDLEKVSSNKSTITSLMNDLLRSYLYFSLSNNQIIAFYGNRVPVILNNIHSLADFAYYLGCYFADGTKKGNSWGLCASTFEQAKYYLRMHEQLVPDASLNFGISYTNYSGKDLDALRDKLSSVWKEKADLDIDVSRIRIVSTDVAFAENRNPFGTLLCNECRHLTLLYYNRLLACLISEILDTKNKLMALNFLCGVLEGDGSPSARARGHVLISTNPKELRVLEKVFGVSGLNYTGYCDNDNKSSIRIGSLDLLLNILYLKDILFKYYPKRRQKLIRRLSRTGAFRFLVGDQNSTSGWIKSKFRGEEILDSNYKLTQKGQKIKKCLLELKREVE